MLPTAHSTSKAYLFLALCRGVDAFLPNRSFISFWSLATFSVLSSSLDTFHARISVSNVCREGPSSRCPDWCRWSTCRTMSSARCGAPGIREMPRHMTNEVYVLMSGGTCMAPDCVTSCICWRICSARAAASGRLEKAHAFIRTVTTTIINGENHRPSVSTESRGTNQKIHLLLKVTV